MDIRRSSDNQLSPAYILWNQGFLYIIVPQLLLSARMTTEEESDVFEIGDFTVVTPMEQFVTAIEATLHDWEITKKKNDKYRKISKLSYSSLRWETKEVVLKFHEENQIYMTYWRPVTDDCIVTEVQITESNKQLKHELFSQLYTETEFVWKNNVTTLYGLLEFILFTPVHPDNDKLIDEDQVNYFRSAFRQAAINCDCTLPMLVQYGHADRQLYFGSLCDSEGRTSLFDSSLLRKSQKQHTHLTGLLNMFKGHVRCPTIVGMEEVRVSVQFEYSCKLETAIGSLSTDRIIEPKNLDLYAIGNEDSSISTVHLLCEWLNISEHMYSENNICNDFEPRGAFDWSTFVNFENREGTLATFLQEMVNAESSKFSSKTPYEVFGRYDTPNAALRSLSGGSPNIRIGAVPTLTNPTGIDDFDLLPLEEDVVNQWISAIFSSDIHKAELTDSTFECDEDQKKLKDSSRSAPHSSTAYRLSCAFYHLSLNTVHPKNANLQLWIAFVQELRRRFENLSDIEGNRSTVAVDLSSCIFLQKLEMLQCCINARRDRHQMLDGAKHFGLDDYDEFYDAEENVHNESSSAIEPTVVIPDDRGRLGQFKEMYLYYHPKIPLYNFAKQNPPPMTEDMIWAHQEMLESLNEDERVDSQLPFLRSNMQAFKAANPQGEFCDFVRWFSPKDWIEEEGVLSERFQIDNVWHRCWKESRPLATVNQTRLFNETSVAEEILLMFEKATCMQITEWIKPCCFVGGTFELLRRGKRCSELLDRKELLSSVSISTRNGKRDEYLIALKEIRKAENAIMMFESVNNALLYNMPMETDIPQIPADTLREFALSIINNYKLKVDDIKWPVTHHGVSLGSPTSTLGRIFDTMILTTDGVDNGIGPNAKRYVLRWGVKRPSPGSSPVPQRMFASIEADECRLAGAFTEDSTFS